MFPILPYPNLPSAHSLDIFLSITHMSFNYQDLAQLHPFNQLFAGEAETGPWCLHVDPQSSGFYGLRWINMYNKVCENKFLPIMLFSVNLLCFLSPPPTPSE